MSGSIKFEGTRVDVLLHQYGCMCRLRHTVVALLRNMVVHALKTHKQKLVRKQNEKETGRQKTFQVVT